MNAERLLCFRIQLTGDLQAVANLVATNRCGRIRIFRPGDLAVVKSLSLQRLLH